MLLSAPAAYEKQTIHMTQAYQEVEKRHGKKIDLAHRSTYSPKPRRSFAFSDSYVPDPGNWHKDWWAEAGFPNGPDTYEELRVGARKIRGATGHPCGLGLSQELDSSMAMRALLWSFGGAEQDEAGNVTINSKNTIEALKYMKALYQESETPEVFTWTPPSNNQAMLAGRVSYVANAISITRQAEREHLPIESKIMVSRALRGPVRRIAAEHVMDCYVIWDFAENKDGAQQFLIDYIDAFHDGFAAGQFYNFPCFPHTVPDLKQETANDPRAIRLREDHVIAHDRRTGSAHVRRYPHWRPRGQRSFSARTPHRHGFPELRALPAPVCLQEYSVSAASSEGQKRASQGESRVGGCAARNRCTSRAQAARALRWRTPTGRACPCDRPRARRVPARRAALES